MSRKIVSQTDDLTVAFPSLDFPMERFFEEDTEVNGVVQPAGSKDPNYPSLLDSESVYLFSVTGRRYDSVHQDYTDEMLTPTEDNDYVIETELDGNFTHTVMQLNTTLFNKYKEDASIVASLGLPEYDPEIHTLNIRDDAEVDKETRIKAEAYAEEMEALKQALLAEAAADKTGVKPESPEAAILSAEELAKTSEGSAIAAEEPAVEDPVEEDPTVN